MKKIMAGLMAMLMIVSPLGVMTVNVLAENSQASPFAGGSGTVGDPYIIENVAELQAMNSTLDAHYRLANDIDASETVDWNGGLGFEPIGPDIDPDNYYFQGTPFTGSLDGDGHVIYDLYINRPDQDYCGLIGSVGQDMDGASVHDLGIVDFNITAGDMSGALAGFNGNGETISNCFTMGIMYGSSRVGGFLGNNMGIVSDCFFSGTVISSQNSGAFVGYVPNGVISRCYSEGDLYSYMRVGGFAGYVSAPATINDCYSTATVTARNTNFYYGGFVGDCYGTINRCYATGKVTGSNDVGGFVGVDNSGTYANCFWDTETTGRANGHGDGADPAGMTGLTTTQALTQATYTGATWDFGSTWWMSEDNTRPFLQSEQSTTIRNSHQLQLMQIDLSQSYTLLNDIDIDCKTPSLMWNTSTGWLPIGDSATQFTGDFDGNGYAINGLFINRPTTNYVGLFGAASMASITNVYVDGNVTGQNNVGILLGECQLFTTVSSVHAYGTLEGTNYLGGIAGDNYGTIDSCSNRAIITGNQWIGGISGISVSASVSKCYNLAGINGSASYVGGVLGQNTGTVDNCYNTGNVTGNSDVGGLTGRSSGMIEDCYSSGIVNGNTNVGGFLGNNNGETYTSYWDTETSETATGIGNGNTSGASGITTAQ